MKKFITVTALTLLCGSAFAQNIGPAPQTSMEKPEMTNRAKENGAMDTTGMSTTKGNKMTTPLVSVQLTSSRPSGPVHRPCPF